MIKGKVEKGSVQVSIQGNAPVLAAEMCCLIRAMCKSMAEDSKMSAETFKEIVIDEVNDDTMFSDELADDEKLSTDDTDDDDDNDEKPDVPDLDKLKRILEGLEKLKGMLDDED
ncbi:MAG: hypothetical protein IJ089_10045 [Clostridia bacterium]|nr:hypothetical protein [Clostridia bacterium]